MINLSVWIKEICTLLLKLHIICSRMQRVNLHARSSIIQVGYPTCCYQVCALDHAKWGTADLDYPSEPCHHNVFCITGPLWGKSTSYWYIHMSFDDISSLPPPLNPPTQFCSSVTELAHHCAHTCPSTRMLALFTCFLPDPVSPYPYLDQGAVRVPFYGVGYDAIWPSLSPYM